MPEPFDHGVAFLGSVPDEIARSEVRRRALLHSLKEMGDERSVYNGVVSALTPAMVYALIDPGISSVDTQHLLVGGVASLASWNISLAARTTDPPALYQRAIGRIACLELESGRYLYTSQELPGFEAWRDGTRLSRGSAIARRLPETGRGFSSQAPGLEQSLRVYNDQARILVQALRDLPDGGRRATCAVQGSIDCSHREALLGRQGIDRDLDARSVLQESEAVDAYARQLRGRVLNLYAQVNHEGAISLHASTSAVMEDLRASLQSHEAPLASLVASLDAVSAQVQEAAASAASAAAAIQTALAASQAASSSGSNATAKANSGRRTTRAARPVRSSADVDLELPDELRREFGNPERRAEYGLAITGFRFQLSEFRNAESDLRNALQELEDLTADQAGRTARATAVARRAGCYPPKVATTPAVSTSDVPASTQVPLASTPTAIR